MSALQAPSSRGSLEAQVEKLYEIFSAEVPAVIEGCPCCIDTRSVDVLLTTPLRTLSGVELWRYISGAYLTVGGDRDFRYLLPRIFELSALAPSEVPDSEIVLDKLGRARWGTWQAVESEAVLEFVDAWFTFALEQDLEHAAEGWIGNRVESILCGLAYAGIPMSNWLTRLTEPSYALLLADMRERYPKQLSAFWDDVPCGLEEFSTVLSQGSA